jgi:erythronate-4-phosphate dehydrogenase
MLIVADENMPYAREVFSRLGEVRTPPGRTLTAEAVREADALMVRSVTRVNEALLTGSRVKFVGTATIGTDHVDKNWLAAQGIGFSAAPGCNAESVAQYVAAALAYCACRMGRPLGSCSIGIVGVGNCGSRVARVARALGMEVRLNDPPLARRTGDAQYRPLDELLDCDFLALHVPLTREGEDATWRLIDGKILDRLRPGAAVINACRGFVLDEGALAARVDAGRLGAPVLDAWENEPRIDPAMLRRAALGTPHIAGYSFDGKAAGTRMIYEAACRHFGLEPQTIELPMPEPAVAAIRLEAAGRTLDSVLAELILTAYPIVRDDADLRACAAGDPARVDAAFDLRRKQYPLRREFSATRARLVDAPSQWLPRVAQLGFTVE